MDTAPVPESFTRPPAPAPKPAASERTIGPEITFSSMPKPKAPASEKTVLIGPEITIPGLNDKPTAPASPPAPAPKPDAVIEQGPMPASPSDFNTLAIERPQHGGVGPAVKAPLPAHDPDGTMRIEKPNPQEPV